MLTTRRRLDADEAVLGVGGGGHGGLQGGAALAVGELLGGLAAGFDDARELALVLGGEQGDLADVVQVQTDGVVHDVSYNRSCAGDHSGSTCLVTQRHREVAGVERAGWHRT